MKFRFSFNPYFARYTVERWNAKAGCWAVVRHPLGKILRTREHTENFIRWLKRQPSAGSPCNCNSYEYR